MLVPLAAYNFVFRNIMKVTGKIIEQVEENWWAIVTDNKTLVYTFLKPEEVEKDMWRVNKQLKPLKSREVITEEETQKMYRAMTLQVQ